MTRDAARERPPRSSLGEQTPGAASDAPVLSRTQDTAMKKRRRDREKPRRFDASRLTPGERAALASFERRRSHYERAIADSNVIHHKHTCPACGFPTLDERLDYELCVVCLWEDGVGELDPTLIGPPNYTSLTQARIATAQLLAAFEQTHEIDDSLAAVVACVRRFGAASERRVATLDRDDFVARLRDVLPTRPIDRS